MREVCSFDVDEIIELEFVDADACSLQSKTCKMKFYVLLNQLRDSGPAEVCLTGVTLSEMHFDK